MKRVMALFVGVMLTACGGRVVDFKDGVPTNETAKLKTPDQNGAIKPGTSTNPLLGETADLYRLTVGATALVNGVTLGVLGALASVTAREPTSIDGDTAIFGPHTPALSMTTWRLSVTRHGANEFTYVLEGKAKNAADTEYQTALSGTHVVAYDAAGNPLRGYGHGTFLVEWNYPDLGNTGSAQFTYAHEAPDSVATIEVQMTNQHVGDPEPWDAAYRFVLTPGNGGTFEFVTDLNTNPWDPAQSAMEKWSIMSRWQEDGAGRSDAKLSGGDLTTVETANECWDSMFASTYLDHSYDMTGWGDSASCVFADAAYTQL